MFMVFAIAAGAIGLTLFASHVSTEEQTLVNADEPGSGTIVRFEALDVWLPAVLIELAKPDAATGAMRTHADLRRYLEVRGQEDVWYAMKVRGHQTDGGFADMPFVRRPYNEPDAFSEFLEILAMAAGNSSGEPAAKFSSCSVRLLDQSLLKRDPRSAVAELLNGPGPRLNAAAR